MDAFRLAARQKNTENTDRIGFLLTILTYFLTEVLTGQNLYFTNLIRYWVWCRQNKL